MKISLNWLRELVELPPTVDALVDLLTLAGVEVEGVETRGCAIPNVIVAQIKESVQHPNADRLSVCKVDDGTGVERQIVCGAKNYKVGDKVPLALPGAKLGPDFTIKVGKLRGVESQGMMCSAKELALAEDAEGLLILPADARIGAPIGDLFPADTVLDLEITPNRADLLSVNGIAREIGALTSKPVRLAGPKSPPPSSPGGAIEITTDDCPLYTARKISGVKVGPSPEWLRARLEAVGLRAINNIVDVMNYVMLELGEPLHAFDGARLDGALNVRAARDGEEFHALDGKTYRLAGNHMVIADGARAVAVAGVMGGEDSGVTAATTEIWIESAYFLPGSIRRTSRQLGLASDASYRFERGVDPATIPVASQRAAELVMEIAGGSDVAWHSSAQQANDARLGKAKPLQLRPARVAALLGVAVSEARIDSILTAFGLTKLADGWEAPSHRPDLTREVDLIEEVARVVGMDTIPARVQGQFAAASPTDLAYDRAMTLRRALVAQGLHEARSLTLIPAEPRGLAFTQVAPENLRRVKNPMIDDQVVLRPGLLHGLLAAVATNVRAGATSIRLFEIGRVFGKWHRRPGGESREHRPEAGVTLEETIHAALVLTGPTSERSWRNPESPAADLYDLKGILTAVLGADTIFQPEENPALALSLVITVNSQPVGFAGQLWPADARALDATAPVLFAEIALDQLDAASGDTGAKKFRDIPRFPAVTRDIALLAPLTLAHAAIESALHASKEPLLTSIALFDVFTDASGARVPADKKSLAYSLTYRAADRTLTAEEVSAAHARLKEHLKAQLGVALRE